MPRLAWALVSVVTSACGGRASDDPGGRTATGGDGSIVDGGETGAPSPVAGGGVAAGAGGEPTGSALAGAHTGGQLDDALLAPLIPSGTRTCQDSRDCLGLECVGSAGLPTSICAAGCSMGDECLEGELCIREDIEPTCIQKCQTVTDCWHPFDCFDVTGSGGFACVPRAWAAAWDDTDY